MAVQHITTTAVAAATATRKTLTVCLATLSTLLVNYLIPSPE